MSSRSAWRWVTSAIGELSATARLSAWTDLSRPTWSGTIISGKMTVSRSATSGRIVHCRMGSRWPALGGLWLAGGGSSCHQTISWNAVCGR